jgi:hypothetical protein
VCVDPTRACAFLLELTAAAFEVASRGLSGLPVPRRVLAKAHGSRVLTNSRDPGMCFNGL